MKLTTLMLMIALVHVSAKGVSQNVTINENNASLEKVLGMIKTQTGYVFFYDNKDIQDKTVSLHLNNIPLDKVLDACFSTVAIDYKIVNKTIVLSKKNKASIILVKLREIFSPPHPVSGTVTDDTGSAVFGVTVLVKGTTNATTTDVNGRFTLSGVKDDAVLVFKSINMEPYELNVTGRSELTIGLKRKNTQLNTVVVSINTGYQTLSKERNTGAVTTINSAQLEQRYNPNLLDELEGRVPGLVTYATGLSGTTASTARSVTIRGVSTLRASLNALIVVDGLPIEGTIDDINPYDVESVSVLQDAAAASLYGVRASNGVIVVTTKKAKPGRTTVEASSDFTLFQKPNYDYLGYMTPAQQVDFESQANAFYFHNPAVPSPGTLINTYINTYNYPLSPVAYLYYQQSTGAISSTQLDNSLAALKNNNYVQQYKDNAVLNQLMQQYNLAIRSGGTKYQSSLVLNFKTNNKGIINANTHSINLFYKGDYSVAKWLDVDFGVNTIFNYDKSQYNSLATSPFNFPAYTQLLDGSGNRVQLLPATNPNNTFLTTNASFQPLNFNALDELGEDFKTTQALNSRFYVHAIAKINKDLKFSTQLQYEDLRSDANTYSEPTSYTSRLLYDSYATGTAAPYTFLVPSGGRLAVNALRGNDYTFRNQFDFNHTFGGKHNITAIGGFEFRQTYSRGTNNLYLGYNDQLLANGVISTNYPAIVAATGISPVGYGVLPSSAYTAYISGANGLTEVTNRYSSGFANAIYTYDGRYNISGSVRKDVANLFGADANLQGRPFYSFGLGWNAHNETFLKSVSQIDFLKFRLTYGLTGNVDNSTSKYPTTLTTRNTVSNTVWLLVQIPPNPNLTWELTHTTNFGTDFSIFKDRVSGTIDLYYRNTDHLITNQLLDATTGYTNVSVNAGIVTNKGITSTFNIAWLKPSKRGGLAINTTYTYGVNINKITHADNPITTSYAQVSPSGGRAIVQGYPVNSLFSYKYNGLDATGQPSWMLHDGTSTTGTATILNGPPSDVVFSGSLDPKTTMGFTPSVDYKRFSFSALFVYYGGHFMRANQPTGAAGYTGQSPTGYGPIPNYLLNAWTPTNTNTLVPGILQNFPSSQLADPYESILLGYSDKFVLPADFIKMRTATLSYMLPIAWAKKIAATSIRLRFQVNNAWTVWTKNNQGIDPEANNAWQGNTVGNGRYLPIEPSYIFGASVNF